VLALRRRLFLGVERLEKGLMQVEFCGHAHTVARQLPAQVREPEGGNAKRANILQGMKPVKEGGGDEITELLMSRGMDLFLARNVKRGDGNNRREKQTGGLPHRKQASGFVDCGIEEVARQRGFEQTKHFFCFLDGDDAHGDQVVLHVLLGIAASWIAVFETAPQGVELGDFVKAAHRGWRNFLCIVVVQGFARVLACGLRVGLCGDRKIQSGRRWVWMLRRMSARVGFQGRHFEAGQYILDGSVQADDGRMRVFAIVVQTDAHTLGGDAIQTETLTA
jgi:hypothetical protein